MSTVGFCADGGEAISERIEARRVEREREEEDEDQRDSPPVG